MMDRIGGLVSGRFPAAGRPRAMAGIGTILFPHHYYPCSISIRQKAANKAKHGIDFVEAQALWADDKRAIIAARIAGEPRFAAIGRIGELMWTAIATMRGENIRFISVRRARRDEVAIYDGQEDNQP